MVASGCARFMEKGHLLPHPHWGYESRGKSPSPPAEGGEGRGEVGSGCARFMEKGHLLPHPHWGYESRGKSPSPPWEGGEGRGEVGTLLIPLHVILQAGSWLAGNAIAHCSVLISRSDIPPRFMGNVRLA